MLDKIINAVFPPAAANADSSAVGSQTLPAPPAPPVTDQATPEPPAPAKKEWHQASEKEGDGGWVAPDQRPGFCD